ncbi:MAG: UDP-N-acetylmuramoyl-tripeptide--D-alanyl-D-alanine ligase [Bacilli bacterium]
MKRISLNSILKALNLRLIEKDIIIKRVKDDIRKLGTNTLIFHLNKDQEINNDEFRKYKDCYIITDQPILKTYINKDKYIYVDNINIAYKNFLNYYRNLFNPTVIAVTGTCGKTTTKEMIAQVLKHKYKVINTKGSKNNLRFHHDYLMKFNEETEYGVFETAITHPGHLILNCEIFKPQIGIITNIGIDHLNWCKSLNNYIRTKAELLVGLKNKGHIIINNDDENIKKIDFSNYKGKILTFGINSKADYLGKEIELFSSKVIFKLVANKEEYTVEVSGNGIHTVYNALATIACLDTLGMDLEEAISYLSKYIPIRSHTQIKNGINGSTIIDDTWSSNPTSLSAALDVLKNMDSRKTKIAVIGKISYLGEYKTDFYKRIAKEIINKKIDVLITIDNDAKEIGKSAIKYGMNSNNVYKVNKKDDLYNLLKRVLNKNTIALFKTSMLDKSSNEIINRIIED